MYDKCWARKDAWHERCHQLLYFLINSTPSFTRKPHQREKRKKEINKRKGIEERDVTDVEIGKKYKPSFNGDFRSDCYRIWGYASW